MLEHIRQFTMQQRANHAQRVTEGLSQQILEHQREICAQNAVQVFIQLVLAPLHAVIVQLGHSLQHMEQTDQTRAVNAMLGRIQLLWDPPAP